MNADVVIAGAGPTGLMLAGELALAGVPTVVVERLAEPRAESMGMAINATVVELLTQRGVMELLAGDGMEWPAAHFAQLWLDPTRVSERHAYNFVVPQARLEQRLEEHAVKLGARVRRGCAVTGLAQDAEGVTVTVRTDSGTDTGTEELRCGYLVGCDGADSTVRSLAGIHFPGTESPFYGIVGELDADDDDPIYQLFGSREYPAGLFNVTPSGPGVVRVTTGEFEVDPPDRDAPVTVAELRDRIRHISGVEVSTGSPRWLARWHHATRHADRYREGRVFVAGDAAHVHFPLGGQALSTDLEDAVNLGWKLAATVRGWAPAGLLDTYHTERHPVGARACETTKAQVALLYPLERIAPVRAILGELIELDAVNEYLVKLAGGLDVRYPVSGRAHPLAGRRLADIPLTTAAGETGVAALLHAGRGVLLTLTGSAEATGETAAAAVTEAAAGWADRVDTVAAGPTAEIGADAVLLRPDGRVAWAGAGTADGLDDALRTWFGDAGTESR